MLTEQERTVTVTYSGVIPEMTLHDILCTAIEGGSGYWADIEVVRETDPSRKEEGYFYQSATFFDTEDDSPTPAGGSVSIAMITKGISCILRHDFPCAASLKQTCLDLVICPDEVDYDALDADCIIQAALFNDIVYG